MQDEEDGELLAAEAAAEAAALARLPPVNKRARVADDSAAAGAGAEAAAADVEDADEAAPAAAAPRFRAHVEVPSQKDIEQRLLERKRQLLLQKYVLGADGGKGDGSVAAGTAAQKPT
jgi:pre-mRNA-splicing factor ISY1